MRATTVLSTKSVIHPHHPLLSVQNEAHNCTSYRPRMHKPTVHQRTEYLSPARGDIGTCAIGTCGIGRWAIGTCAIGRWAIGTYAIGRWAIGIVSVYFVRYRDMVLFTR